MRTLFLTMMLMGVPALMFAQSIYFSRDGKVNFFSDAPMEEIESINKKASSVLDISSGKIEFSVLMKAFEFKKALMQEHFNENYVESHKYPKAVFKGTIQNHADIDYAKDGSYDAKVAGDMTIHGVTQKVEVPATIIVENGQITGRTEFGIKLSDYEIDIPKVVEEKIAEEVLVTVAVNYQELKK